MKALRILGLALLLTFGLASPVGAASAPFLPEAPNCPMFPANNVWNKPVNALPVEADSSTLIASIGLVLCVPLTTAVAVVLADRRRPS